MSALDMANHTLIAVDATHDRCSCGDVSASWKEHLATVAFSLLGVEPGAGELEVTREDVARTRRLLAHLAARQESLGEELDETGLTDFVDRSEWLIAHRSADEKRAWELHWLSLGIPADEIMHLPARPRPHVRREFEPWQEQVALRWARSQECQIAS